ncbi:Protein involved in cell differentiation/sexual development [Pseudoloma neurophilia]|uniref:Protein involved in cell differentiation/sexual development n=1 Tax=Pseudoloma neurophilia TaxID=146866 RepID=A0A0R0M6I7_9MICR|nr:Protein involved in cell differentiation/sexual development [Pseudoloma neurophilia]
MPSFEKSLQSVLLSKNRSTHLKEIFLHLETNPNDSLMFWNHSHMKYLVLQVLIQPYVNQAYTGHLNEIDSNDMNCNEINFNQREMKTDTFQQVITVLNILQIIVIEESVRLDFINLNLPFYIYPYLNNFDQLESLRIASLGVFGQLLKNNDKNILNYLMSTEMIPFCLKLMDIGSNISRKISIHIFYSIIKDDHGLEYACQTFERFIAISVILNSMMLQLIDQQTIDLLEPILDCYLRLTEKQNVLFSFKSQRPEAVFNDKLDSLLRTSNDNFNDVMIKDKSNNDISNHDRTSNEILKDKLKELRQRIG